MPVPSHGLQRNHTPFGFLWSIMRRVRMKRYEAYLDLARAWSLVRPLKDSLNCWPTVTLKICEHENKGLTFKSPRFWDCLQQSQDQYIRDLAIAIDSGSFNTYWAYTVCQALFLELEPHQRTKWTKNASCIQMMAVIQVRILRTGYCSYEFGTKEWLFLRDCTNYNTVLTVYENICPVTTPQKFHPRKLNLGGLSD